MTIRPLAFVVAAAFFAGCGGGGNGSPVPPAQPKGGSGALAITIKVPGSNSVAARRHGLYISRDTKGIGVEFVAHGSAFPGDATPTWGQSLGATANGCPATANTDGSFTCTIYIAGVPAGHDDFRISLWNAYPATCTGGGTVSAQGSNCSFTGDSLLSQWNSTTTYTTGYSILSGQSNALAFTLDPVVDSVAVSLNGSLADGQSSTATATLTFKDAAGDIILGSGEQLVNATGTDVTVQLNIVRDLDLTSCGSNQTKANGCSLYFGTSGAPAASNPTYSTDSSASETITYDGAAKFPANNAYASFETISPDVAGDTVNATINGHLVSVATTGAGATDAANLAAAINANSSVNSAVFASSSGTTTVISSFGNLSYTFSSSCVCTNGSGVSAAGPAQGLVPEVTASIAAGSIAGAKIPATFSVSSAGTGAPGGMPVPGHPAVSTLATGANAVGLAVDSNGGMWSGYDAPTNKLGFAIPEVGSAPTLTVADNGSGGTGSFTPGATLYYKVVFKRTNGVTATGSNTAAYADQITNLSAEASVVVSASATNDDMKLTIGSAPAGTTYMDIYRTAKAGGGAPGSETLVASNVAVATTYLDGALDGAVALPVTSGNYVTAGPFTPSVDAPAFNSVWHVAVAANGNVCFTDLGAAHVGCFSPATPATTTWYHTTGSTYDICQGPDGNIWFTEYGGTNSIGVINAAGVMTQYTSGSFNDPRGINAGPDGNLWVTQRGANTVTLFNPVTGSVVTSYGTSLNQPINVTQGSDGNMWVANLGASTIDKIIASGVSKGTDSSYATGLTNAISVISGADGNLWVAGNSPGTKVSAVSTAGTLLQTFTVTTGNAGLIRSNPLDGKIYVPDFNGTLDFFTP